MNSLGPQARRALEAILFAVEDPVDAHALAQVLEVATDDVVGALHALRREYVDEGRGFVLRETGAGWRLYTDPSVAPYVDRFVVAGRTSRLSQAALETLAIVAYKQPVTRAQIAEIRGVDADAAVRGLLSRGLIVEAGRDPSPGQPMRYATSDTFLEHLGLGGLAELPPLPALVPPGPLPVEPAVDGYRAARRELRSAADDPDLDPPDPTADEAESR